MNYKKMIGIGVAGNIAGHLDQAGEAAGFSKAKAGEKEAPKGIFPFYVPANTGKFFEVYPFSSDTMTIPEEGENLQIEPELAIICNVAYENQLVKSLTPTSFAAFNDGSIRKLDVKKLSRKKNWGTGSKGVSETFIDIDEFTTDGILGDYSIVAYVRRDGVLHPYGVNSHICDYSYIYQELLDWIVSRINTQPNEGPLDCIIDLVKQSEYPEQAIIAIGATNYTDFGKKNFLKEGDEGYVVIYSRKDYTLNQIETLIESNTLTGENISILHQTIG